MTSARQIISRSLETRTWNQVSKQGLNLLQSPLLGSFENLVHAFTTRHGGETSSPYEHFNLGRHVKDPEIQEDALRNREKLCRSLGLNFENVAIPGQVHSATVKVVETHRSRPEMKAVDGLVTGSTELPLVLHFADCVPVIVYDRVKHKAGVFHAGWRGTAAKIVGRGVELLMGEYGCQSKDLVAAVGPAIGRCCYPTGDNVYEALRITVDYPDQLFGEIDGQKCPDLKAINAMQLMEAGVTEVDVSDWCTACAPELFYSHRQSGGTTGRQAALVSLA